MYRRTLLLGAFGLLLLGQPLRAPGADGAGELYPDLRVISAGQVRLEFSPKRRRLLRFDTEILNSSRGPLELEPRANDCNRNGDFSDDRTAYQRIYRDRDGDGLFTRSVDTSSRAVKAGCTLFHRAHDHWHFENLAGYTLHRVGPRGASGRAVRATRKVSFCVYDGQRSALPVPGAPGGRFYGPGGTGCDANDLMGLSAGWVDRYSWNQDGQHVDITGIEDGTYCLVLTIDPANRVRESNERNNTFGVRIAVSSIYHLAVLPDLPC